ncbi:MAG: class I SAM-dependent methyltransferase, partial [Bacteroidetes bacterium]|nr:class I SAM-dependent methyltransferase [Bacteroidota bacterium]
MDSYKETFKTWNKIASVYEDKFMDLELYNDIYDIFCELLDNVNPRILDVGFDPGNITKYILFKRPDFNIQEIDIATNMIELARKNNPTANFKVMDGRQIHKLEANFDAVVFVFFY